MSSNRRLYKKDTYKNLPVNNNSNNLIPSRLGSCYKLIHNALDTYSKLLHQHRVLKIPKGTSDQYEARDFERLTKHFFKQLENGRLWDNIERGKLFYAWSVEREDYKGWHVHLHTFVNEKKNRSTGISHLLSKAWDKTLLKFIPDIELKDLSPDKYNSSYVYTCIVPKKDSEEIVMSADSDITPTDNNKYHRTLSRDNEYQLKHSFYWISYICKVRKGTTPYKFGRTKSK